MSNLRETVLLTLIELAVQPGCDRSTLCIGIDAHELLTRTKLADYYQDQQLRALYPQFLSKPTAQQMRLKEVSVGKEPPIAIYHMGDQIAYFEATKAERDAWNIYAQKSADAFDNDPRRDSYDSTAVFAGINRDGEVTSWCPPLYFPEWRAALQSQRKG